MCIYGTVYTVYITNCNVQVQKCQQSEMTIFHSSGKGHCQCKCGTPAIEIPSMHDLATYI